MCADVLSAAGKTIRTSLVNLLPYKGITTEHTTIVDADFLRKLDEDTDSDFSDYWDSSEDEVGPTRKKPG